jgi:hypothetical protein
MERKKKELFLMNTADTMKTFNSYEHDTLNLHRLFTELSGKY